MHSEQSYHSRSCLCLYQVRSALWCDWIMVRGMRRWCVSCVGSSWSISYCCWSCSSSRGGSACSTVRSCLLFVPVVCLTRSCPFPHPLRAAEVRSSLEHPPECIRDHPLTFSHWLSGSCVSSRFGMASLFWTLEVLVSRILTVEIKSHCIQQSENPREANTSQLSCGPFDVVGGLTSIALIWNE